MGRLVMDQGWTFNWVPEKGPTLIDPEGRHHPLRVDNYVPIVHSALPLYGASEGVVSGEVTKEPARLDRLRKEAQTALHQACHLPKNDACEACRAAKMFSRPARRHISPEGARGAATKWGDLITMDHIVMSESNVGFNGDRVVLVVKDVATGFTSAYPSRQKSKANVAASLRHFLEGVRPKQVYSDNAPEIRAACKAMGIPQGVSTPYRHETNGVIERTIGLINQLSRTVLYQSGLPVTCWPLAVRYAALMLNMRSDLDGGSPWSKRFEKDCRLTIIPFGAAVTYKPLGKELHKFDPTSRAGVLIGYTANPGCRLKDYLILDIGSFLDSPGDLRPHVQRAETCSMDEPIAYPLAIKRDALQVAKLSEANLFGTSSEDLPVEEHDGEVDAPGEDVDVTGDVAFGLQDISPENLAAGPETPGDANGSELPVEGSRGLGTHRARPDSIDADVWSRLDAEQQDVLLDPRLEWVAGALKDPTPVGPFFYPDGGEVPKPNRGSNRPPDVWPWLWATYGPKQRKEELRRRRAALEVYEKAVSILEAAKPSGTPEVSSSSNAAIATKKRQRKRDRVVAADSDARRSRKDEPDLPIDLGSAQTNPSVSSVGLVQSSSRNSVDSAMSGFAVPDTSQGGRSNSVSLRHGEGADLSSVGGVTSFGTEPFPSLEAGSDVADYGVGKLDSGTASAAEWVVTEGGDSSIHRDKHVLTPCATT